MSIKSHFMANRESVMLLAHCFITSNGSTNVWQDVSIAAFLARQPYLVPQQIEGEWGYTSAVQTVSHFMSKRVSSTIVFKLDRLISAHPMTNSK